MEIILRNDFPKLARYLDTIGKQARYAAMLTINETAYEVRRAEAAAMRQSFDRPTPYTLGSVLYTKATKDKLMARIYLRDDPAATPADKFLGPQIEGGARNVKRFEKLLQRFGKMPPGTVAVPGAGARLDRYGNLSQGQLIQILSQLKVTGAAGYTRNISAASKKRGAVKRASGEFFATTRPHGSLQPGVYLRKRRGNIKPILMFVKGASYKKRLDFYGVAERTVRDEFPARFDRNLARALATAR